MSELATTMRERVEGLEEALSQFPQVECGHRDHFAPGVYVREMTVPKDVYATGAVHKTEHLTVIVGHCVLTTDDGPREFRGCHTVLSKPGAKRAIYAIEDTTLWTIHPTTETDPERLCELLTEAKASELLGGKENRQLLAQRHKEIEL